MADIEYLKGLKAVRERAHLVLQAAEKDELTHFSYFPDLMPQVAGYVAGIIDRDFGPDKFHEIPPHGRWQHFNVGGVNRVEKLIDDWRSAGHDELEITRRLVDLFFVAVLLDAGAGDFWKFTEPNTGNLYGRSEGIAVAALYMFKAGTFSDSSVHATKESVDGKSMSHGLSSLDIGTFRNHFQITPDNEIIGDTSRVDLLNSVGVSLLNLPEIFGSNGRPGSLVDYLLSNKKGENLDYETLWSVLQKTLLPAWPKNRTQVSGVPIGDAWPLKVLEKLSSGQQSDNDTLKIQPFHKLTQWLAYSLSVPFIRILQLKWENIDQGTGLPEYRNGGLFVDLGVLKLKDEVLKQGLDNSGKKVPSFDATSDVIVEWRAMTVALLDSLHGLISDHFAQQGVRLSMTQMLEAGAWKGGRELAAKYRPETRSSPIVIEGDGTLF
ncbi:uncharacterized protein N7469_009487 [Penicillium citrinum]|uniref:Uracil catabolism protein 4 n=2 Tax=Penicillium TaxID=5073 RepID=A0A9W9NIH3_PENCI|nr:uncharacterized protein N7469_009487 [Penicillium citrinum]KAJ5220600.1 hypothetical protein N7469_009487 [Penicillium citrinum]KAJ5595613.1 hypothetical protein N7450_002071 [Penicillium hetheringtonii]